MNVIVLTVFLGVMLVSFFICMFLHQSAGSRRGSDRDALLPLANDRISPARARNPRASNTTRIKTDL
jgi:hypothetical protein